MTTYNANDIAQWINFSDTIGGRAVNFIIELNHTPRILNISSNVTDIFGYQTDELIKNTDAISKFIYQKDLHELYLYINNAILSRKKSHTLSFSILSFDGTLKPVECFFKYIKDKKTDKLYLAGYLIDITQKKSFQRKIDYLTNYDSLTGLINREKIKNIIDKELKVNLYTNTTSAILYLDLNRFKNVNDTLGYDIGDKLLQHVSHRLVSCIKEEDILARVGDDEFVILLSKLNKKTIYSHVEIIAKRLYQILERPFSIDNNLLHITTSIGVSILGIDGNSSNVLLKAADMAMCLAKKDQDNYLRYYKSNMKDTSMHLETENDLRVALHENQFELYYQPQVDVKSDLIIGAEALIRWHHPVKGMMSPLNFIPIAEDTGLIIAIGEWVLIESCKRIKELQDDSNCPRTFKKISVNISSKQFAQPSFTADVKKIIIDSGIDPSFLELEVTEGALISNLEDTIEKMHILKELGIKFSIDDFGTGYSSLTYLKKLPIDIIKIDKSFITNMHADSDDKVLTQTIIQMSQNLRLGLIAEGVEKVEHLNFLQEKGCESYQGYFFSKPIPFDKFKALLFSNQIETKKLLRYSA
jgi:diguanylate cyclase (GGDEF)-like protein/PAS domain S-box-containing protein